LKFRIGQLRLHGFSFQQYLLVGKEGKDVS